MAKTTIEWTAIYNDDGTATPGYTFNPWEGCTKVSDGCKNCYAEARANRFGTVKWGPQGQRRRTSAANWKKPLAWNRQAEKEGRRYRVFCASLADVFEDKPDQPEMDDWRAQLMQLIQDTPNLDWLLLTKRPENVMRLLDVAWQRFGGEPVTALPPNVWIGTSVENQQTADERIPELLQIPAAVRFLSMEPLLGPVNIEAFVYDEIPVPWQVIHGHWVIVGGESGPNARPMHPDWARALRDQCYAAGVPFFFKQWGEWCPYDKNEHEDWANSTDDVDRWQWLRPDGLEGPSWKKEYTTTLVKVGKKAAGRLLDGREWNEMPGATP